MCFPAKEEYAQQKHRRWGGYEDVVKIFQEVPKVQSLMLGQDAVCSIISV